MPEWIPTESSPKGRLVLRALDAFSAEGFVSPLMGLWGPLGSKDEIVIPGANALPSDLK